MLKIRLRQQGKTNRLTYRLVVVDARFPRDGKYIENLGHYDPCLEAGKDVVLHEDRIEYWIGVGAQPTEKAVALLARKAPEVVKRLTKRTMEKAKKRRKRARRVEKA